MFGDPGPCPVCGAPHTACTAPTGAIVIQQLPQRDASPAAVATPAATSPSPPLYAERLQATLPAGHVTTGTYHRPKRGRK